MKRTTFAAIVMASAIALASGCATTPGAADFAAAVADPSRPEADRVRDSDRRPAELVAFAGVKPGSRIAELAPGGGYFTRILSNAVGPAGKIYAMITRPSPAMEALAKTNANVHPIQGPAGTINVPEPVDMVWTTLNYHDFKNVKVGDGDAATAVNAAAFRALKPGGTYLIVDHASAPGTGSSQTSTLHRIDPALVRSEVEAAGFRLSAESALLRHPADDHSLKVQETGIRGKTDQFVFRFTKPKR